MALNHTAIEGWIKVSGPDGLTLMSVLLTIILKFVCNGFIFEQW